MRDFQSARRNSIARNGRSMTLRRLLTTSTVQDVAVTGFLSMFKPEQFGVGGVMQGDGMVALTNDEIAAASWPGPPRVRDQMVLDTRVWTVLGVAQVWDGSTLIGFNLTVRGG